MPRSGRLHQLKLANDQRKRASQASNSIDLPLPITHPERDPTEILHCSEKELPSLAQAWTELVAGLRDTSKSNDDDIQSKQRVVVESVLQRLLKIRYPDFPGSHQPRKTQIEVLSKLVFDKQDILLVVRTGFGKSLIFQAWTALTAKMAIVIVPLNGLADQIYADIQNVPGSNPIILSGETKLANPQIHSVIEEGQFTHIITSPEQAVSPKFCRLLRKTTFAQRIGLIVIDEAHCVAMWSTFRSEYAKLHVLRDVLPTRVRLFACTATLTKRLERQIIKDAGFNRNRTWDPTGNLIRGSVDRPEISIAVEILPAQDPMHRLLHILRPAIEGMKDLERMTSLPIPDLTVIFANTRNDVADICECLRDALFRTRYPPWVIFSSIKVWTSHTAKKDRANRMKEMRKDNSKIRILVATTAFGMGLDIPNIKTIYQYKAVLMDVSNRNAHELIPCEVMQRGGRAVRNGGQGLFVIMLEHDITAKEKRLEEKMLRFWEKSVKRDQPLKAPRGSKHKTSAPLSRRSSLATDSIGRYAETPGSEDTDLLLPRFGEQPGEVEEDATLDGLSAAVNAVTEIDEQDSVRRIGNGLFSWTALLQSRDCLRKYFLTSLGNDMCRPDLQEEPPATDVCCSRCNSSLVPEKWGIAFNTTEQKERAPREGTDNWLVLQYIQEWFRMEVARISSGNGTVKRLFTVFSNDFFFRREIQYRIAKMSSVSRDRFRTQVYLDKNKFLHSLEGFAYEKDGMFERFESFFRANMGMLRDSIAAYTAENKAKKQYNAQQVIPFSQVVAQAEASS
jgi:superfamily II DNA or RNA helicase